MIVVMFYVMYKFVMQRVDHGVGLVFKGLRLTLLISYIVGDVRFLDFGQLESFSAEITCKCRPRSVTSNNAATCIIAGDHRILCGF